MRGLKQIDGLPIKDARKSITLEITADDVKRARRKKPNTCAIAQTCLRQPGVKEVKIHLSRAYIRSSPAVWTRYFLPRTLRSEIIAFDRGGRFAPGEYMLYKIHPSQKIGKKQSADAAKTGHKKHRKPMHFVQDVRPGAGE